VLAAKKSNVGWVEQREAIRRLGDAAGQRLAEYVGVVCDLMAGRHLATRKRAFYPMGIYGYVRPR
jgi:hypothetical protein